MAAAPPAATPEKPDLAVAATSSFALRSLNATIENKPIPNDVTRHDICVETHVSLERAKDKTNTVRQEYAAQIKDMVQDELSTTWYTGTIQGGAPYTLKVYVVIVNEGSLLNALTFGLIGKPVQECLEWFFIIQKTSDGSSETLKAGRVGIKESACLMRQDVQVTKNVPELLIKQIVEELGIENNK